MKPLGKYTKIALLAVGLFAALVAYWNRDVVAGLIWGHPPTPAPGDATAGTLSPPPREAGPAELALVAPLKKGGKLLDYDIKAINGVENGVMGLVLTNANATVDLTIAMAGDAGPLPPFVVGPYAIFYSGMHTTGDEPFRLAGALLAVVKANVGAPTPPGLSSYLPRPTPQPTNPPK